MTNQHPITPPPKLVREWLGTYFGTTIAGEVSEVELALATQAAQWGADQELEACCEYLKRWEPEDVTEFCDLRRPKPPSLKEQALGELGEAYDKANIDDTTFETIRKALEALPE